MHMGRCGRSRKPRQADRIQTEGDPGLIKRFASALRLEDLVGEG
jgi:hypothetical protein